MTSELQKKIDQAIKLLQVTSGYDVVEISYSGGKDSDVILELAKMSGIKYRVIYKCTTVDVPGTLKHVKEMGAEVLMPKKNFFQLIEESGFPNRFKRFCCRQLKEYKVLDKAIIGIRRSESVKRAKQYTEPTECKFYGSKKNHVEVIYPILNWTDNDIVEFVKERGLKLHPIYYREDGSIDPTQRVGCMCCPLASRRKRINQFIKWPNMVKAYIRAAQKFRDNHPDTKQAKRYDNVYDWFVRDVFYDRQTNWEQSRQGMFEPVDSKAFLEEKFNIRF